MSTKTKRAAGTKRAKRTAAPSRMKPKRGARKRTTAPFAKPYDAKEYAGSVPAFASVVAEEMRKWRDDR